MSDFRMVQGFEDVWRPVSGRRRSPQAVLGGAGTGARARLQRLARRAPEVMVKVTGRTADAAHLRAHLDYISRKGSLALEDADGWPLQGRAALRELAADWAGAAAGLRRSTRAVPSLSLSIVLSMPTGTDPFVVRDAARAFAAETFGGRFDYLFVLHTDTPRPHVHLCVARQGQDRARLNPKKADLEVWRQLFAAALRDRGVEAEATPRRARGVTRKPERAAVRRIRERAAAGRGPVGARTREAYVEAARTAFGREDTERPWEARLLARQTRIRGLYLAQARLLQTSADADDRRLGAEVERFVRDMPAPDTRRLALARQLGDANRQLSAEAEARRRPRPDAAADRGRDR